MVVMLAASAKTCGLLFVSYCLRGCGGLVHHGHRRSECAEPGILGDGKWGLKKACKNLGSF